MKLNNKGITIVELLMALVLVALVGGAAWTAFLIGMSHSAVETKKTHLQQEANAVVTKLRNEHRKSDLYFLRFRDGNLELQACSADAVCTSFSAAASGDFTYSGTVNGVGFSALEETVEYRPKERHTSIVLRVADPENSGNFVEVKTVLTRILTDS